MPVFRISLFAPCRPTLRLHVFPIRAIPGQGLADKTEAVWIVRHEGIRPRPATESAGDQRLDNIRRRLQNSIPMSMKVIGMNMTEARLN